MGTIIVDIIRDSMEIGLIWSLMALGVFISFRVLDFPDLTTEGSITLGSSIVVSLILLKVPPVIATVIAIFGGFVAGVITGIIHTKLKIPTILAGIITMTGLYSINLRVLGKSSEYLGDSKTIYSYLRSLINDAFYAKTLTTLMVVIGVLLILYWFFGTEIGISVRATGMNRKMAKAQGVDTDLKIIFGLGIANGLIALCGALFAQSTKSANMDLGKGTIVIGLASIILGEIIFGKRSFKNWLLSVILGSIIYQVLVAVAIELGLHPNDLKLLQAILIAFILSLPLLKKASILRLKKNGDESHAGNI